MPSQEGKGRQLSPGMNRHYEDYTCGKIQLNMLFTIVEKAKLSGKFIRNNNLNFAH
jgi:hypothetical protein